MQRDGQVPARLLARGFSLLFQLSERPEGSRLAALAAGAGLSRATSLRILRTLADLEVVTFDHRTKLYSLGPRLIRLHGGRGERPAAGGLERPVSRVEAQAARPSA